MTYPSIIFLGLLLWSFSWPKEDLVYLVFGTAAFQSLAVIPPAFVAGADLLPNSLTALVIIGRYTLDSRFRATVIRNAFALDRMGLFTFFMIIAGISAMFFPRLFAGQVEIVAMRATVRSTSDLLGPTSANFTQLAYLCLTYGLTLCLFSSLSDRKFVEKLLKAFALGGAILIATGLADMALGGGDSGALAAFKTANYTDMAGAEIMGVRRIIGFMSEASAYGSICAVFAAASLFTFPAIEDKRTRWMSIAAGTGCLLMAALSTSSTAIVGLGVLCALYGANLARRILGAMLHGRSQVQRSIIMTELTVLCLLVIAVAIGIALEPDIVLVPWKFIDELVFHKAATSSYYERNSWSRMAMDGLYATHGLGVGIGGARASNWMVSVLSNSGVLGAACLFGFIGWNMVRPIRSPLSFDREAIIGARLTVLVSLAMAALSGTSPDIGVNCGAMLALACALAGLRDPQGAGAVRRQALNRRLGGFRTPVMEPQGVYQRAPAPQTGARADRLRRWQAMAAAQPRPPAPTAED